MDNEEIGRETIRKANFDMYGVDQNEIEKMIEGEDESYDPDGEELFDIRFGSNKIKGKSNIIFREDIFNRDGIEITFKDDDDSSTAQSDYRLDEFAIPKVLESVHKNFIVDLTMDDQYHSTTLRLNSEVFINQLNSDIETITARNSINMQLLRKRTVKKYSDIDA